LSNLLIPSAAVFRDIDACILPERKLGDVSARAVTRVSTDQGLDQDFNSLDAQYEAASAYIKSHALSIRAARCMRKSLDPGRRRSIFREWPRRRRH
jgi:hypothetical protein